MLKDYQIRLTNSLDIIFFFLPALAYKLQYVMANARYSFITLKWKFFCWYMQQTNTADMLEEAVEYVKFLQKQIQVHSALN